jgi:hypothetical protein
MGQCTIFTAGYNHGVHHQHTTCIHDGHLYMGTDGPPFGFLLENAWVIRMFRDTFGSVD